MNTDLKTRGLINEKGEYPFKNFPLYDYSSVIHGVYQAFFKSFVDSYYENEDAPSADFEVQNWVKEANTKTGVQDFPKSLNKDTLVDILSHFGFIVSVVHPALNGGDPVGSKATLPFHLPALYAPLPEKKGVTDLIPFLPPPANSIHYIGFIASFNRPFYETSSRTL
ncbi:MAG: hypothetical protein MMC23_007127 [Stictis urceolatum]|nr:hypothetical protein [Stictis urceolata]